MQRVRIIGVGLLVLTSCLIALIVERTDRSIDCPELIIHCAAGLQKPVEEIAKGFEKETGISVSLNLGGSGQLYSQLDLVGGDVYIPADMSYIEQGQKAGLIGESTLVSRLVAELIVRKGNPKNISSLKDLARDDLRVVIADRSAAIGLFTHEVLVNAKLLDAIEKGKLTKMATVNEVALQIELGAADVGIVWNVLEPQFESCDFISVAEFQNLPRYAGIGYIIRGEWPKEAGFFISYIIAKDKGLKVFQKYGFDVIGGLEDDNK